MGVEVSNEGSDSAGLEWNPDPPSKCNNGLVARWNSTWWTAATCAWRTSSTPTSKGWSCSCLPNRPETRRTGGIGWRPKPSDSEAIRAWKQRIKESEEGKKIYKQRAATSETVNAELRTYRGLAPLTVRGFNEIKYSSLSFLSFSDPLQQGASQLKPG